MNRQDQPGSPAHATFFDRAASPVLVTGATGAIGPIVVAQLWQAGARVRVLARRSPPAGLLPPAVELCLGEITDPLAVERAMQGCQRVVHLAALLHIVDPPPAVQPEYQRVNVQGTANIVDAAVRYGVERLVFCSTIAVYGQAHGQILHEATPPQPDTLYGQSKLAAEQVVLAARHPDGRAMGVGLRLAAVYGARVKGNYARLLQALARGRFVGIGPGKNRRTLVYEQDVARAILLALRHPAAGGQVYNVTDGTFHTVDEILRAMATALGRQPPRFALPVAPTRWLVRWLEKSIGRVGWRSPVGCAAIDKYIEDIAVDGQRIRQEMGFIPQFDLRRGWQDAVQTLRRSGGGSPYFDK